MQKVFSRMVCLLLVMCLLLTLWGCQEPQDTLPPSDPTQVTDPPAPTDPTDPTDPPVLYYTYRDYLTKSPTNFDPLSWETEQDQYIIKYTTMGLYAAVPNAAGDNYMLIPEMAAAEPVDVTKQYAGKKVYGIPASATGGYAWQIDLNPQAVWEDGTPINADTYVKSMERLLSYVEKYDHADTFCSGIMALANAYTYNMQDYAGYVTYKSLQDAGYTNATRAVNDGHELFVNMSLYWDLDCGWVSVNDKTKYRDKSVPEDHPEAYVSAYYLYNTYLKSGQPQDAFQTLYLGIQTHSIPETTFDQVGILKTGEYQITLIMAQKINAKTLMSGLRHCWIVPEEMYAAGGYGTEAGKYLSCGPYRIDSMEEGKSLTLVRNERWYGYSDGKHAGQYQAQTVYCRIIPTHAEALYRFEKGELDRLVLASADMEKYGQGDNTFVSTQTATTKLTVNSQYSKLSKRQKKGTNKTVLNTKSFRQGLSLCIDRAAFVAATNQLNTPSLSLLSSAYLADPENGIGYRSSEVGQKVLQKVYGTDEQGNLISYDPKKAGELFVAGYQLLLDKDYVSKKDVISLDVMVYSDDESYQTIVKFLQAAVDEAVVGTVLEGRIKLNLVVDKNYYAKARKGDFDIILSTLSGDELDPYSMMGYYCDPAQLFEYGFLPDTLDFASSLSSLERTRTYYNWYWSLCHGIFADVNAETRTAILADLEMNLLAQYRAIPLYDRNTVTAFSAKVSPAVPRGVHLLDVEDLRFMVFVYDDQSWENKN